MDIEDFIGIALVTSLVVIPALGATARFALKPIVDALIRLKEGGLLPSQSRPAESALLVEEVRRLREEVAQLTQTVNRLEEAESFHRRLAAPPADRQLP